MKNYKIVNDIPLSNCAISDLLNSFNIYKDGTVQQRRFYIAAFQILKGKRHELICSKKNYLKLLDIITHVSTDMSKTAEILPKLNIQPIPLVEIEREEDVVSYETVMEPYIKTETPMIERRETHYSEEVVVEAPDYIPPTNSRSERKDLRKLLELKKLSQPNSIAAVLAEMGNRSQLDEIEANINRLKGRHRWSDERMAEVKIGGIEKKVINRVFVEKEKQDRRLFYTIGERAVRKQVTTSKKITEQVPDPRYCQLHEAWKNADKGFKERFCEKVYEISELPAFVRFKHYLTLITYTNDEVHKVAEELKKEKKHLSKTKKKTKKPFSAEKLRRYNKFLDEYRKKEEERKHRFKLAMDELKSKVRLRNKDEIIEKISHELGITALIIDSRHGKRLNDSHTKHEHIPNRYIKIYEAMLKSSITGQTVGKFCGSSYSDYRKFLAKKKSKAFKKRTRYV